MISVIVPARNAEEELPRTLAALRDVEVVVVANGCSDGTARAAREGGARVVEVERANRAAARNRGAREAGGELLLFTDAGVEPSEGWVGSLAACLGRTPLAGGPVSVTVSKQPTAAERFDRAWRFQQEHAVKEGGWSAGANLGITRAAFDSLNGFAEDLAAGDDVDLCVRARAAGLALGWCDEAVVSHPASEGIGEVVRRAFRQGASSTALFRRHGGAVGRRYWTRPGGIARARGALAAVGVDADSLPAADRRRLGLVARADYAARFVGSLAAEIRR